MTVVAVRLNTFTLRFDSQTSSLVIGERDTLLAVGFLQDLILGAQVFDDLLLLPVYPACKDEEEKLPGLQDKVHGGSDAVSRNRQHRIRD